MSPANIRTRAGASSPSHSLSRFQADTERAELLGQADGREPPAATDRWPLREVTLVALDVSPLKIPDRSDLGCVRGQPDGELAQDRLDADHRRGPQREACLLDVPLERRS